MATEGETPDALDPFRQFFSLQRDVLVLSVAMFAFSLGFQMTSRYLPEYMAVLGASTFVIGLYGTFGNVISALYPYPGGALSDRIGSRVALTLFGFVSTLGFLVWLVAPLVGTINLGPVAVEPWIWIFVGLVLAQGWKSFGLGATYAIVKQSVPPSRLARGFASTETFRRTAFLVGPLIAAGLLYVGGGDVLPGFLFVLVVAVVFGAFATVAQHVLYDASEDTIGKEFEGVGQVLDDLRDLPPELRPLLVGDTLVRFANGMVYIFFVIVVTRHLEVDATLFGIYLSPEVFFGLLLGLEMLVALLVMAPAAKVAESVGLKPVVGLGFAVYAIFPVLLIYAPTSALVVAALFAFSGLRFAGLPSHKALIVGPAERDTGGRVAGAYYLIRNTIVIPSAALGGALWEFATPELAFTVAAVIGIVGTAYFFVFGKEFDAYA
ncbi:MFS transporter [Natrarchaeobaculum aegyptiacum]|uniref:MFS transporter n=1 Tax=Natrarchaeobaculum aegyptiacum TaxID=745377 RepID=A0A2Z2HT38_9EURY|nr:MFS transporter [Natrarchaeobaculum aegyptiacum]ARS90391.1 MFS transporter [Natrarchaeobaculum aegyptiacum]